MKISFRSIKNGQSLVEMALLLPVLLMLSVVAIDFGRGVYYFSAIFNAAREGARYGIIHPEDITGIQDKAIEMAVGVNLDPSNVTVSPNPANINIPTIQVSIIYCFDLVTPIAGLFTNSACGDITLRTSSTMKIER
jgi:Flp pilus assembly protein TadG